jgi:2,4-dienoyl-CoA reductase-like NADH-dependent reductase (Old Yellow Enzyme family)
MSILFTAATINGVKIKNRFVRSATYEGMGTPDWRPTRSLAVLYSELADAEIGLIITGGVHIDRDIELQKTEFGSFQMAIDQDNCIEDWQRITELVKKHGSKIMLQIYHPGRRGRLSPIAPSAVADKTLNIKPRAMTVVEIRDLVEKFAQACRRSLEAGFDGVQLHGAHGQLISNFISPYTNIRTDQYGGSTENRARFVVEIIERARELVGTNYPLMIKMNCNDFVPAGLDAYEAARVARIIVQVGVDCIEVSGGIPESRSVIMRLDRQTLKGPNNESYFRDLGLSIKKTVSVPVILVGGMRTPSIMENIIEEGIADFISLSRPLIREPALVKRWKTGDRSKARCLSCSECFFKVLMQPLKCYAKERRKKLKKREDYST